MSERKYRTLTEFYPFYLKEHSRAGTRLLHFIGTTLLFGCLAAALWKWWIVLLAPVCAYGCAWFGHFVIERNRPATFTHPLLSLVSDFRLYFEILTFRRGFVDKSTHE